MEKQILKILKKNNKISHRSDKLIIKGESISAKAIASIFGEFIEWFTGENSPIAIIYGGNPERFATSQDDYTIDELFLYWFENIKTK